MNFGRFLDDFSMIFHRILMDFSCTGTSTTAHVISLNAATSEALFVLSVHILGLPKLTKIINHSISCKSQALWRAVGAAVGI